MAAIQTHSVRYQLVFDIQHAIFQAGNETKLLFSMYDNTIKTFISEQYCLHLHRNNFPKVGSPEDCKVLFKNITADILTNDIYIICYMYRIGGMQTPDVLSNKKKHKRINPILRPYAVSILKLKDSINKLLTNLGSSISIEPTISPICVPKQENNFNNLPFDIINGKHSQYSIAPLSIGIAHQYILYKGDISIIQNNYQYYDTLTHIKLLNTCMYHQNDNKSYLHLTVVECLINPKRKPHLYNIKIKLFVKTSLYEAISSIMYGNGPMSNINNNQETVVFYQNNNPIFNQTFKILIPTDIENHHLYFNCLHIRENKQSKYDENKGFTFIKLSDIRGIGYNEYILPLYINSKKWIKKKSKKYIYLSDNLVNCKSDNEYIKIGIRWTSAKHMKLIVFGYVRELKNISKRNIPHELILLMFRFFY